MRVPLKRGNGRFFSILASTVLAACALFAVLALLMIGQIPSAQAQGGTERWIVHTLAADFDVCAIGDRTLTDAVVSNAEGGELRLEALFEDYFDGTAVDESRWEIFEIFSGPPVDH